jgi:hypothetical protein
MGLISRIFGIDELIEKMEKIDDKLDIQLKVNDENNETMLSTNNSLQFVDPIDKKAFLSIESMFNEVDESNRNEYNLKPLGSSARMLSLLQHMPMIQNLDQAKKLEGAYKVVFPEGAIGRLMEYKNGTLGTPLVKPNGKIGSHAGLLPIDSLSLNPAMIFTAVSLVTGQYFMAKINKSLESISKDVKDIITMMLDDKEARNQAIFNFYGYIRENLEFILNNSDLKLATLTNLQSYLIDLNQNKLFYEKTIDRKKNELQHILEAYNTTNKRVAELEKLQNEVSNLLMQQHICLELYVIGKIYEMQLAQIYGEDYCNKLINELDEIIIKTIDFSRNIANEYIKTLNDIEESALINKDKIVFQREQIEENIIKRQYDFKKNIKSTVNSITDIIELNRNDHTFILKDNNLYYLENNVL